jgi:hypothetical protein
VAAFAHAVRYRLISPGASYVSQMVTSHLETCHALTSSNANARHVEIIGEWGLDSVVRETSRADVEAGATPITDRSLPSIPESLKIFEASE